MVLVSICLGSFLGALHVGRIIDQQQVVIAIQQRIDDGPEKFPVAAGKITGRDAVNGVLQFRVGFIIVSRS